MIKILYTQQPDGEVLEWECYYDRYGEDRKRGYKYLLDSGYEIVGEA